MNSSRVESLFSNLVQLAGHPEILFLVLVGVPLVLWASHSPKYRWWLLLVWAFFLPLTPFKDWRLVWTPPPFPFNVLVEHGRQIAFFLMLAMIPAAVHSRKFNDTVKISPALIALLLVNAVYCLRYIPTAHVSLALLRLFSFCVVFLILAMALPKRIGDRRDIYRYLVASAGSALLVVAFSIVCYVFNPSSVVKEGRMGGLTSNPNFLGTLCGLSLPVFLGLCVYPNRSNRNRMFWILATGLVLLVLAWTGSRTAFGMACVGVIVMFHKRLGNLIVVAMPLAVIIVALGAFLSESKTAASRLTTLGDTRSAVWYKFYDLWHKDPIMGNADLGMSTVESSYLTVVGNAGLPGAFVMLLFLVSATKTCLQLYRMHPPDPEIKTLRDIALSGILVALAGAFFISYMVASLSTDAYWIFLYFILAQITFDFAYKTSVAQYYPLSSPQFRALSPVGRV